VIIFLQHIDFLDFSGAITAEPVKLLVIGYIREVACTVMTFS
jgi:hypothetical protein